LGAAGVGPELGILASGLAGAGTSAIMGGDSVASSVVRSYFGSAHRHSILMVYTRE